MISKCVPYDLSGIYILFIWAFVEKTNVGTNEIIHFICKKHEHILASTSIMLFLI